MSFYRMTAEENRERRRMERQANLNTLMSGTLSASRGTYAGATTGEPIEKGEKARPGKRAPTKNERDWMDKIVRYGCIACRLDGQEPRPTAVHHLLRGGVRMGHMHTIGLCDPGHHQNGAQFGMVSRHPDRLAFEAKYGTEAELLDLLRDEIGIKRPVRA